MTDKATKRPLPPHASRPLLVAADEPIDAVPARYGLVALLYPPARGLCAACKKRATRLTKNGRRCPTCATQAA